jgi:hypothetical protein
MLEPQWAKANIFSTTLESDVQYFAPPANLAWCPAGKKK